MTLTIQTRCDKTFLSFKCSEEHKNKKVGLIIIVEIVVRWLGQNLNFETVSYLSAQDENVLIIATLFLVG